MPIYEYRCQDCNNVFEEWHRGYEEKEITCPECKGVAKRLISNTAFILKGSGWYVTDYARGQSASGAGDGNGNGDGKGAEETASSTTESGNSTEKSASGTSGESGGNGKAANAASGEKSGSGGDGAKTDSSRTSSNKGGTE